MELFVVLPRFELKTIGILLLIVFIVFQNRVLKSSWNKEPGDTPN